MTTLPSSQAAGKVPEPPKRNARSDLPSSDPFKVHVVRTSSPRVLRWVCHRSDLVDEITPPERTTLTEMIASGMIHQAVGRDGNLLVDFGSAQAASDAAFVRSVHDAVVAALHVEPWERPVSVTSVALRRRNRS